MGLFENIFKSNQRNFPEQVFQICLEATSLFPINYIEEFGDEKLDEHGYGFGKQYKDCRRFTSLVICCSIVFLKTSRESNRNPDPFNDKFYKPFIALILMEAAKIQTRTMYEDLSGGFDGEDFWNHETPQYKCREYMQEVSFELLRTFQSEDYLPTNLAYNYYVNPGTLWYSTREKLNDDNKAIEIREIIKVVKRYMKL